MHRCKKCTRYHPKAAGHCKLAGSVWNLEKIYGFSLAVVECPHYLAIEEVFPAEWTAEEPKEEEEKPKRKYTRKKKVTLECGRTDKCECEGDDE